MARTAGRDTVAADMRPTDYRGAVNRMKAIKAKSDKQKSISSEIGDIYAKCEGVHGVNKAAAKIFHGLSKLEPEGALLVFRDLNGLLDAAGFAKEGADLVDQASDNVVSMRFGAGAGDDGEEGGIDDAIEEFADDGEKPTDDDPFEEASSEELAAQKPRAESAEKKAVGRAKKAFGSGPAPEPYTGYNFDLADGNA